MKWTNWTLGLWVILMTFACSKDEISPVDDQIKSYELIEIKWKLDGSSPQNIVEKKIPEYYFHNDTDTPLPVVIHPLDDLEGSSLFEFDDVQAFEQLHIEETQVSLPNEISLLSEQYAYLIGDIQAPLSDELYALPFTQSYSDSTSLEKNISLTANYTVFLKENKARFLAKFKEHNTGEILELSGKWTGIFFDSISAETEFNETE